jgi:hypothetical protein
LLVVAAVALAIAALIPQTSPGDTVAYARRLSSLQARFGSAAQAMRTAGMFSITRSWGFRALSAVVASCVALRLIEVFGRLRARGGGGRGDDAHTSFARIWAGGIDDALLALAHSGGLVLLAGLAATQVWGWQRPGVVLQGESVLALPGRNSWVALTDSGHVSHSPGVRVLDESWGPGALIRAADAGGEPLALQQDPGSSLATEISLALVRDPDLATRDAIVAIPGAQLIVRLLPSIGENPGAAGGFVVQAYRSPSGALAMETVVDGDASLRIDDVTLEIVSSPYVQLSLAANPGTWVTAAGLLMLVAGLLAQTIRRLQSGLPADHDDRDARRGTQAKIAAADGV